MIQIEFFDVDVLPTIDQYMNVNLQSFLQGAGVLVIDRITGRLQRGVAPDETPFTPNAGRYAAWKQKYYPGKPPLTLTGEMATKIENVMSGDEAFITMATGRHSLLPHAPPWLDQDPREYIEIARGHETGQRGAPREFLGINDKDIDDILELFAKLFEPDFV